MLRVGKQGELFAQSNPQKLIGLEREGKGCLCLVQGDVLLILFDVLLSDLSDQKSGLLSRVDCIRCSCLRKENSNSKSLTWQACTSATEHSGRWPKIHPSDAPLNCWSVDAHPFSSLKLHPVFWWPGDWCVATWCHCWPKLVGCHIPPSP